jgi:hypothetical protein
MRYESSPGELSSPPSGSLSDPDSPSRQATTRPPNASGLEEIVVGNEHRQQQQLQAQQQGSQTPHPQYQTTTTTTPNGTQKRYAWVDGAWVQLTAAGVPRKKPGRKPGTVVKPKIEGADQQPKARKPRKPRDPNAPPIQRKRKLAPASDMELDMPNIGVGAGASATASAPPSVAPSPTPRSLAPAGLMTSPHQQHSTTATTNSPSSRPGEQHYSPKIQKTESYPSSMQSILNSEPAGLYPVPVRTSGQNYDPIRGNYDPVRETITTHKSFSSSAGSPRAPTQLPRRSPSIASLIDAPAPSLKSPNNPYPSGTAQSRVKAQESASLPASPAQSFKPVSTYAPASKTPATEPKKDPPPPPPPTQRIVIKDSNLTTISNGPVRKVSPKQKPHTGVSTPKTDNLDDLPHEPDERSILDFGKARPGEETEAPTIILSIPIQSGETNKYVNFMRLAEERYGWDALHPRLAANRDRKARIAAAAASLEKIESGRESGDEMSVDESDAEVSNQENGVTSGLDTSAKPKKKRTFKEDQYDVDDDFVDDSELLWEAQAAASRDGFFVYSGPLVPEVEKPASGYVTLILLLSLCTLLTDRIVMTAHLSEAVEAEVAAVVGDRRRVERVPVAAVVPDPVAVPSLGSLVSLNLKRPNASVRRLNGRTWRNSQRPLTDTDSNRPRLPLL